MVQSILLFFILLFIKFIYRFIIVQFSELRVNLQWIFLRRLLHKPIWSIQWPSRSESGCTNKKHIFHLFGPIRRIAASTVHGWHLETTLLLRHHCITLPSVLDGCKLSSGKHGSAKNVPECVRSFDQLQEGV